MKNFKKEATSKHQSSSAFNTVCREFMKDKIAMFALIVLVAATLFIIITPLFIDSEWALSVNPRRINQAPSDVHILGTDIAGRDVFTLLVKGAGNSLLVALAVTVMSAFIGITLGLISGYFGGRFDNIMMRVVDFVSTLPALVMIIAFLAIFPGFNVISFSLIMTFFLWTGIMRLVRARAIQEKELEYIQASKTLGTPNFKIIFRELLPNVSSIIIVNLTLNTAANVGLETGLSFLGFGFGFDEPSLGALIASASDPVVMQHRWWNWIPAGIFVLVLMLSINTIGRTLNRATDARMRRG